MIAGSVRLSWDVGVVVLCGLDRRTHERVMSAASGRGVVFVAHGWAVANVNELISSMVDVDPFDGDGAPSRHARHADTLTLVPS